jgi:hypothetical protein
MLTSAPGALFKTLNSKVFMDFLRECIKIHTIDHIHHFLMNLKNQLLIIYETGGSSKDTKIELV